MSERLPRHWEPFCRFADLAVGLLLALFARFQLLGSDRVPLSGPLLLVSNHNNNADPLIIITQLPRRVHIMAKEELHRGVLGVLGRALGSYPVRRGQADRQALATSLALLAHGHAIGLFPEGTRSKTGGLGRGQLGAGLIALRADCPILPVGMVGSGQLTGPLALLRRPRIRLVVGEPFVLPPLTHLDRSAAAAAATNVIMQRLSDLLPPEQQGAYRRIESPAAGGGGAP